MSGQQSIHNNKYVVALLGGKVEIAKVKTQALRTSKTVERALDEIEAERIEDDADEADVCTRELNATDLFYLY
jgi:hypothetical protein